MILSRRSLAAVAVAALALGSAGCRKTVLQGRIHVPNSDLANIAVRIVPEAEVKAYFDAKAPQAFVELEERRHAFENASRAEEATVREHQRAYGEAREGTTTRDGVQIVSTGDGSGLAIWNQAEHSEAEAKAIGESALAEAEQKRVAAAERLAADKPALEQATSASRETKEDVRQRLLAWETDMLADMPEKGEVVYTDAQGRFTTKLPRGRRVAVVASGDFKIGGTMQHRGWGLWVTLDASEKVVELDAGNLLLQTPRDSVLR